MSDDTPTQRLPEPGDNEPTTPMPPVPPTSPTSPTSPAAPVGNDAPTQRFEPPAPPTTPGATGTGEEPPKKSKALLITLISIGAALLIAIILLLIWLFASGQPPHPPTTPSASATPSASPSETPSVSASPSEAPPLPGPSIASFVGEPTTVDCAGGGAQPVTFSWQATGTMLWFAPDTPDASTAPGAAVRPVVDDGFQFNYLCGEPDLQHVYTITVQGENGQKASQSVVITETD